MPRKPITRDDIAKAVKTLHSSTRGARTLISLHPFLANHLLPLDTVNRAAFKVIIDAALNDYPGTALEMIKEANKKG